HGAVAQGIGEALLEAVVYGDDGQLLTATLMDYALPKADDVPPFEIVHLETPSPVMPGGVKGMGEGGTLGAPAAIANAVAAAVPGVGKTPVAVALARSIGAGLQRMQFPCDLRPSDLLGVSIWQPEQRAFVFKPGPLFTTVVGADEINRTTPKAQSSLLEAMNEA